MDKINAKALLEKYKTGILNPDEKLLLENWYLKLAQNNQLSLTEKELEINLDQVWNHINLKTTPIQVSIKLWKKLVIAASIVVVGLIIFLYKINKTVNITQYQDQQLVIDIEPGGNRATLTLANGKIISLDDAGNGKLAEQSGIIITKTKDGQLIYTVNSGQINQSDIEPDFNTITTPKGGQYQIQLPDGSRVWLNSESSLKYPTFFTGNSRSVSLTGEAYFEILKNQNKLSVAMPFIVHTTNQTVEVLGTHFNVNAYKDEPYLKTTLIEGAVKVTNLKKAETSLILKPGEQSSLIGDKLAVSNVNTEEIIAWKNGMFMFKDANLKVVMRSIARWYDIEVEYEGVLPNKEFSGEIHRNLNLKQVLEILDFYKVHFRFENKKLIVSP